MTDQINDSLPDQHALMAIQGLQSAAPDQWNTAEDAPAGNPLIPLLHVLRGRVAIAITAGGIIAFIFAGVAYSVIQPTFQSTGIVQVRANKAGILYQDRDDSRLRLFDAFVASEASYLESRPVLERALTAKSLKRLDWAPTTENFNLLRQSLEVKAKGGLITVACQHAEPKSASAMVNAVLDAYQELHVERSRREDSVRERQLEAREKQLLQRLSDLEDIIREVGQEYSTQTMASAHVRKIAQMQEIDDRINELSNSIAQREAELSTELDVGDSDLKRLVVLDQAMADLTFEKAKRVALLASLPATLAENHPAVNQRRLGVESLDAAIEDRRAQISTLGTSGALTKSGANGTAESLGALRTLLDRLLERQSDLQSEARELNSRLIQLEFSKSEHAYARDLLEETRLALERVRVESQNTLPGTIDIRVRGSVPTQPANDKRRPIAAAGACGGGVLGLASVVGFGFVRRRLRYKEELDNLLGGDDSSVELPCVTANGATEEAFRYATNELRNSIQMQCHSTATAQVMTVIGTRSECGNSVLSLSLSNSFAAAGEKTLVLEANALGDQVAFPPTGAENFQSEQSLRRVLEMQVAEGAYARSITRQSLWEAIAESAPNGLVVESEANISVQMLSRLLQAKSGEFANIILDVGPFNERLISRFAAALSHRVILVVPSGEATSHCKSVHSEIKRIQSAVSVVFNAWTHEQDNTTQTNKTIKEKAS